MINITAARKAKKQSLTLDIAPLIDMVFILLIFFLVTTSFVKETGVDVNRPTASTAVAKENVTILVGITAQDKIYVDNREIDLRALRLNVERALGEKPDGSVVIVADKNSTTGTAIAAMDQCRLAGAENVSLAAGIEGGDN
ncbi:MAG: biopolymer transporter ExbD [Desulfobacterium sp.]|jgi:biopolymer transport protein ExbD|nr:biopolymer transporter ExbD [Desulfobacterium sp.]